MGGGFPFKSTDDSLGVFMDYASAGFNSFANNIWNVVTGKEKFGQHKNWAGGKGSWASETMRGMMEGGNYKEWDNYYADINRRKLEARKQSELANAPKLYEPDNSGTQITNWATQPDGTIKPVGSTATTTKSKTWYDEEKSLAPVEKRKLPVTEDSRSLLTD